MTRDAELLAAVREMSAARYLSIPRILLDVLLWAGAAAAAVRIGGPWASVVAILFIGAVPLHDLLVQGHEGSHDLISRRPWLNEAMSWFALGIVGISRTAHREFHLDHHRSPHGPDDPEFRLFDRVVKGVPGWAYLLIPFAATAGVDAYPFLAKKPARVRRAVVLDLALSALLHGALVAALGLRVYLLFVVGPMFTGLLLVNVVRSVCEHHAVPAGDEWQNARSIETSPFVGFLWSNVNFHLEHHLYPRVPFHRLPRLRRLLAGEYGRRGAHLSRGYLRTTVSLLREREHFKP
jgi:fatty acid desaturase